MIERERPGTSPADRAATDREVAARLAAGDRSALSEVYQKHVGLVFGLARRILGDDTLAEKVTQEVFVLVWQQPTCFDPSRESMRSWLGLLAHRRSVDRLRAEALRHDGAAGRDWTAQVTSASGEVDADVTGTRLAERVREALDQLAPEQRDAVVLAYFGGRTYQQVATELAMPEGTARSTLRLALAKLSDLLRPAVTELDASLWS